MSSSQGFYGRALPRPTVLIDKATGEIDKDHKHALLKIVPQDKGAFTNVMLQEGFRVHSLAAFAQA